MKFSLSNWLSLGLQLQTSHGDYAHVSAGLLLAAWVGVDTDAAASYADDAAHLQMIVAYFAAVADEHVRASVKRVSLQCTSDTLLWRVLQTCWDLSGRWIHAVPCGTDPVIERQSALRGVFRAAIAWQINLWPWLSCATIPVRRQSEVVVELLGIVKNSVQAAAGLSGLVRWQLERHASGREASPAIEQTCLRGHAAIVVRVDPISINVGNCARQVQTGACWLTVMHAMCKEMLQDVTVQADLKEAAVLMGCDASGESWKCEVTAFALARVVAC